MSGARPSRSRKSVCLGLLLIALSASPAQAHTARGARAITRTLTFVNQGGLSGQEVRALESALQAQATQLRYYWRTPLIRFGTRGWRVVYQHYASSIPGIEGNHDRAPSALITSYGSEPYDTDTMVISHEVLEMLADPSASGGYRGQPTEPCDPVSQPADAYLVDGVWMSDFVTPAWFGDGAGPYDWLRSLTAGGQLGPGAYAPEL